MSVIQPTLPAQLLADRELNPIVDDRVVRGIDLFIKKQNEADEMLAESARLYDAARKKANEAHSILDEVRQLPMGSGQAWFIATRSEVTNGYQVDGPTSFALQESDVPEGHYVYALLLAGTVVYVGQSTNWARRVRQHADKQFDEIRFVVCPSENDRLDLEAALQQRHLPQYNRRIEHRS